MSTLLIDGNNLAIRIFFSKAILEELNSEPKFDLWKYMTFDQLMRFTWKFKAKKVIIAKDGPSCWRKQIYKQYKSNRAKVKKDSPVDWTEFFKVYDSWISEIKEHIPFKILSLKYCEADDIIAVLAKYIQGEKIIISTDSDFSQILDEEVKVYNPTKDIFIEKNPNFVNIHSLDGLKKDNIQNILTPIDWDGISRSPRFGESKAKKILESGLDSWLEKNNLQKRFTTLKKIIDFNYIPEYLVDKIKNEYDNYSNPSVEKISEFLIKHNWKYYREKISETEIRLMEIF